MRHHVVLPCKASPTNGTHIIFDTCVNLSVPGKIFWGHECLVASLARVLWVPGVVDALNVALQVRHRLEIMATLQTLDPLLGGVDLRQVLVQVCLGLEERATLRAHVVALVLVHCLHMLVPRVLVLEYFPTNVTDVFLLVTVGHLVQPQFRSCFEVFWALGASILHVCIAVKDGHVLSVTLPPLE